MPKQKRWVIKRDLEHSLHNIDRAIDDLVIGGYEFEVAHPEYYRAFSLIVANLYKIKDSIADLEDLI